MNQDKNRYKFLSSLTNLRVTKSETIKTVTPRSSPVREETGEEREAPPPPPAAEESSSYYSSEDEEVPETISEKVAAPPPVPSQETKPKQRPADTPSSSSEEEEEEEEDQVGPIQTAQQKSVVRKSSPEEISPTVGAQSAPRATSRQIKRPSQNKVSAQSKVGVQAVITVISGYPFERKNLSPV